MIKPGDWYWWWCHYRSHMEGGRGSVSRFLFYHFLHLLQGARTWVHLSLLVPSITTEKIHNREFHRGFSWRYQLNTNSLEGLKNHITNLTLKWVHFTENKKILDWCCLFLGHGILSPTVCISLHYGTKNPGLKISGHTTYNVTLLGRSLWNRQRTHPQRQRHHQCVNLAEQPALTLDSSTVRKTCSFSICQVGF